MTTNELCNVIRDYAAAHKELLFNYYCCGAHTLLLDAASRLLDFDKSGLTPEEISELAQAKRENRLAELPYPLGSTVYTLELVECPDCGHYDCYYGCCGADPKEFACHVHAVRHVVAGYVVRRGADGRLWVSGPGRWQADKFVPYVGVYRSLEEAKIAVEKYNAQTSQPPEEEVSR